MKTETELIRTKIHGPLATRFPNMYLPKIVGTSFGAGIMDKLGCIDGVAVGIEVKKQGKVPTKLQLLNLEQLAEAGGVSLCATILNTGKVTLVDHTLSKSPLHIHRMAHEIATALRAHPVQHAEPHYLSKTPVSAGTVAGSTPSTEAQPSLRLWEATQFKKALAASPEIG